MRILGSFLIGVVLAASSANSELQSVEVGGQIRIRGNYATNTLVTPGPLGPLELRWPASQLLGRPIGGPGAAGGFNRVGILSPMDWDNRGSDFTNVEQRTRLHVKADFTDDVRAFVEFDSYNTWADSFRSNPLTGVGFSADTTDSVDLFQAYIEANNLFDVPLRLRVGRQELRFGSEWLVGGMDDNYQFFGLSFDAVRLTYTAEAFALDAFALDAFAALLAERGPFERNGDAWFYGLYGSYTGIERLTLDVYWLYLRDSQNISDTNRGWIGEWAEGMLGLDDYGTTHLHTVGVRAAGLVGSLDFEGEVAYQFGDAGQVGTTFKPFLYGDDNARFDAWAGRLEVGYSFDAAWKPRPFLGAAYFGGEDNRDISFLQWINPFDRPRASVSFNRLFSNIMYSGFLDGFKDMSNAYVLRAGVVTHPTSALDVVGVVQYFATVDPFDAPVTVQVGRRRVPVAPLFSFWTEEHPRKLGVETDLFVTYHYSEDLKINLQWSHLFPSEGLERGSFTVFNGLLFNGGTDRNQADYISMELLLNF